jgi:hypothetical protein
MEKFATGDGRTYTLLDGGDVGRVLAGVEQKTGRAVRSLVFGTHALFTGDAVRFIVDHQLRVKYEEDRELVQVVCEGGEDIAAMTHLIECPHCKGWVDPGGIRL